jgi:anti-sigma factor ChrR (cupin superfamily)
MIAQQPLKDLLNSRLLHENLHWLPHTADQRHGVDIVPLYSARDNDGRGPAAALLRYRPGARVTRHVHLGFEMVFVLDGVLVDDHGEYSAGTLQVYPPGSAHALRSDAGCIFLVVWEQPVKVTEQEGVAAAHDNEPAQC